MKYLIVSLMLLVYIFIPDNVLAGSHEPIKLMLHHFFSPKEPAQTKMLEPWAREVERLSKDKVNIVIVPGMRLGGKPGDLAKQAGEGKIADLVWTINGYSGKDFQSSEVFELPFVHTNDPIATNLAMKEMFDSELKQDYDRQNLEVMFLHVHQGQAIQSKGFPVRKPEDFRGKRTRIPSRTGAWVIDELKGVPVSVPINLIPQTLQRRTATIVFIPFNVNPLLKLEQHVSHFTEGHNQTRFGSVVFQVSMNKDKWNSLSPDIQKAFRQASGEKFLREIGQMWKDDEQRGIDLMKIFRKEHIVLTEEETEAFRVKLEPVVQKWIQEVESEGIDGKALVTKARRLIAKHSSK
jgi:TRAP-type C4-dicarboxylate transport system substrate-binding protein